MTELSEAIVERSEKLKNSVAKILKALIRAGFEVSSDEEVWTPIWRKDLSLTSRYHDAGDKYSSQPWAETNHYEFFASYLNGSVFLASTLDEETTIEEILEWLEKEKLLNFKKILLINNAWITLQTMNDLIIMVRVMRDEEKVEVLLHGSNKRIASLVESFEKLTSTEEDCPEINVIVCRNGEYSLKEIPFKVDPKILDCSDLDLFYGEGMSEFHKNLTDILTKGRKGIAIFHGPPGGGKSTYIRKLLAALSGKKRIILATKEILEGLSSPSFMEFTIQLHEEPSILIIEDAEDVITTEARSRGSAVSTLLNLTDGILNDLSGLQVILTYNCDPGKVDPALYRKGRLIAKREFNKLSVANAKALSVKMGLDPEKITRPVMISEILSEEPLMDTEKEKKSFGF